VTKELRTGRRSLCAPCCASSRSLSPVLSRRGPCPHAPPPRPAGPAHRAPRPIRGVDTSSRLDHALTHSLSRRTLSSRNRRYHRRATTTPTAPTTAAAADYVDHVGTNWLCFVLFEIQNRDLSTLFRHKISETVRTDCALKTVLGRHRRQIILLYGSTAT